MQNNQKPPPWFHQTEFRLQNCSIFRYITPYGPLKFNRRFGGTCLLHHQGSRRRHVRNWQEARSKQGNRKHRSTFNGQHGIIAHYTELFITTAVGVSNPTEFRLVFEKKLVNHFVYCIIFEVFTAVEMHTVVSGL
jgi:hypothetical protein